MPSFGSLYTVRSGLFASQRALEIVGQNVSNASTAGYTRQEVAFAASEPNQVIKGGGRGISDATVLRYRDEFMDRQFRSRSGAHAYHDARSSHLAQVERIMGTLQDGGMRTALDSFFNAWHNLSIQPSDASARMLAVDAAAEFVNQSKATFNGLIDLRASLDEALRNDVASVNLAARQIAEINRQILTGEASKGSTNELRDQRDKLLDSLSQLTGATVQPQADGSVTVQIGSLLLVDKSTSFTIDQTVALEPDMDPDVTVQSTRQYTANFTWNGTGTPVKFNSGQVAGLLDLRDQTLPDFMKYLDTLVRTVADQVNTAHKAGVPAANQVDIFNINPPFNWMGIDVNPAVQNNPGLLTAAGSWPPAPGDGDRARQIGALRDATVLTDSATWPRPLVGAQTVSPGQYLRTIVTVLGLQVQQSQRLSDSAGKQAEMAEKQRQSVSGVSLDDEMTKMITYQQGYNAAARMMTTIDEMLDTLINRVGAVGR